MEQLGERCAATPCGVAPVVLGAAIAMTMPNPADAVTITVQAPDENTPATPLTLPPPPTQEEVAAADQVFEALADNSQLPPAAPVNLPLPNVWQPSDGLTTEQPTAPTGGNGAFANLPSTNPQGQAAQGGAATTNTPPPPTVNATAAVGGPSPLAAAPSGPVGLMGGMGTGSPTALPTPAGGGFSFAGGATPQAGMTGPSAPATLTAVIVSPSAIPASVPTVAASPSTAPVHAAATPTAPTSSTDPPAPSSTAPSTSTPPAAQPAGGAGGLTGIDPAINATEGTLFNGTVAEFTDSDGNTNPSVYQAYTDFGDGQQSQDMVSYANGTFSVNGSHTYPEEGSATAVTTITDTADNGQTTVQSPVTIADASLSYFNDLMGSTFQAQAGTAVTPHLGSFQDADPNGTTADYTVAIDWGDGTPNGSGTTSGSGTFSVGGTHTYTLSGTYSVVTTITDAGGASVQLQDTAQVSPAPPTPTVQFAQSSYTVTEGTSWIIGATLSAPSSQTVTVQYTTQDGNALPGVDYTTATGTMTFAPNTTNANFTVPVLDDNGSGEGTETFDVVLSKPTNATLGTPSRAPVSITEDSDGGNPPLTLTNLGNQSGAEGNPVSLQLQATDTYGDPLTYGVSNLPAGLTLDTGAGLISGTLAYTDAETQGGSYPVTLTVYDNHGDSASQNFTWTVSDTQVAPTLTNPGDQSNPEGDTVYLPLSASDPDGDPLAYSATGLPAGLSVNPTTGVISGIVQSGDGTNSPYAVTVTASDGTLYNSQSFNWVVPHIQIDPLSDQSNLLGDSVSVPVNAWSYSGQPLTYSATGLPGGVSIDSQTGLLSGTIANTDSVTTPYSVTVTATDGTDPASTSFNWTLSDLSVTNPGDQTNAEGDAVALQLDVQDNNPNAVISYSATGLPGGLAINPQTGLIAGTVANLGSNSSPYSVTVSATDGTSTDSEAFNWTITHVLLTDPGDQINAPNDVVALQLQASDPDKDTLTYGATGLPTGLSINTSTGLISGTIASNAGSGSPYTVTLTASDGAHTASDMITWNISNGGVTVTNPGAQNSQEGATVSLPISASDANGNVLAYTATGLPAGLQIDYASGIIAGTIDSAAAETQGGVYQVTVLADNGQGGTGSTAFTWNVSHVNQAPTLDTIDNQVDQQGDIVSLPVNGYDADGDTVSYTETGLPPGLSIDTSTGVIAGTVGSTASGSYAVTVTASDGTLNSNQPFTWVVTANPVTLTSPGDQTNTEGNVVSLQLSASDANHGTLTYAASSLPAGLSINTTTGLISGTVASNANQNGNYGIYNTLVTATDSQGYSSGQAFTWTIDATNPTPTLTNPGTQINAQGDVVGLQLQASDPDNATLTYSGTGLPPGLTVDASTGLVSGVVSATGAGSYAVTLSAGNGTNNASASLTWYVTNGGVTVTNPGTQSGTAGSPASLQINASDSGQHPLTYTAAGLPTGLSINSSTGLISGTIDAAAGGVYTSQVMAADSYGNSGSQTFTWNVTATNQAPVFQPTADQLDQEGDNVSLQVTATDADGETVTYSATGLPAGLSINTTSGVISGTVGTPTGSYAVTITATDGHTPVNQTFNWVVTQGVVVLNAPADQTNTQGDTVSLQLSATDANQLPLTYQAFDLPAGLTINTTTGLISGTIATGQSGPMGDYTVTVQASDSQGNSSAQQFTWTVNPLQEAPTITNPGSQSNAEGNQVSLQVQASDADGDTLSYAASGLPLGLAIDNNTGLISGTIDYAAAEVNGGSYMVTVTADDGNGAAVSQTFQWTVADTDQGPWLAYPTMQDNLVGDTVNVQLSAGSPDGRALTYSSSGLPAGLSVDSTTGLISGTITAAPGSYTPTVTVSDGQLNASQTFTWNVSSTTAPQVVLAINGTVDHSDDVAILGAGPLPVVVTLENAGPGVHQITLQIPSGRASLDRTTLQMADGGSATVMLTGEQASTADDDTSLLAYVNGPALAGAAALAVESVTFTPIRNADTPAAMKADRIPPWGDKTKKPPKTKITVTLAAPLTGKKITLSIANGTTKFNGTAKFVVAAGITKDKVEITKTTDVYLVGWDQTDPTRGTPNQLTVVAMVGTQQKVSSRFSVAAIPQNFKSTFWAFLPKRGGRVGIKVKETWDSDSDNIRDLNFVFIRETVAYPPADQIGSLKNLRRTNTGYMTVSPSRPASLQPQPDHHYVPRSKAFKGTGGSSVALQVHLFWDWRTGSKDIPMTNSGYKITKVVEKDKEGKWKLTISKVGANTTANGFASNAGATDPKGGISKDVPLK